MHSRFWKMSLLVVVFSFSWGAWWSFYRREKLNTKASHGPEIRLLIEKNFLPDEVVKTLQRRLNADLQVTEEPAEIDLLRELLSHSDNYDIVELPSFVMHSFIKNNVLKRLNKSDIPSLGQVSIDFKHLDFDPDGRYFVPVTWGVGGFLYDPTKSKWNDQSILSLFNVDADQVGVATPIASTKISLMDSPIEFLNLIAKLQPIVNTWAQTDQMAELSKTVHAFASQIAAFTNDPTNLLSNGSVEVAQTSNGRAADFLKNHTNFKFVLPKEKGVLWVHFLAITRGVEDVDLADEVLDAILQPSINKQLIKLSHSASVLNSLNSSSLPELQKARYIREVPLSRFELYVNSEAIQPTWLSVYQGALQSAGSKP